MRRFALLLMGIVLGGGAVYTAFHFHVVRTDKEWLFVPKREATLNDAFADVREWSPTDWRAHPDLIQALIAHKRSDVFLAPAPRSFFGSMYRKIGSALDEASETVRE